MNVDWKQLASMCLVFTAIIGVVLWVGSKIYFPVKQGDDNTRDIIEIQKDVLDVEEETESDIQDVRIRMNRAWDAVNEIRNSLTEVKSDQRLIKKDVEIILAILRRDNGSRAYRNPRENMK